VSRLRRARVAPARWVSLEERRRREDGVGESVDGASTNEGVETFRVRGVFAAEQDGDAPSDVRDVGDGGRADRVSEGQDGVERGVETEGGFGLDRGFRSTGRRGGAAEGRRELFQVSRARNGAVRRRGVWVRRREDWKATRGDWKDWSDF